jgi:hypothetical protein
MLSMNRFFQVTLVLTNWLVVGSSSRAHYPWLALDGEGRVIYFFGEDIHERDYHLPESLAGAKVLHVGEDGKKQAVALKGVESEDYLGNLSDAKFEQSGALVSKSLYGVYHGTKLTYYAQHLLASRPESWPKKPQEDLDLQATLKKDKEGATLHVLWKGKPLPGVKVTLHGKKGAEKIAKMTSDAGAVQFSAKELAVGLNGVLVGYIDKEKTGDLAGKPYSSESHYLTVTFFHAP